MEAKMIGIDSGAEESDSDAESYEELRAGLYMLRSALRYGESSAESEEVKRKRLLNNIKSNTSTGQPRQYYFVRNPGL